MQEQPDSALIALLKSHDLASRAQAIHHLGKRKATGAILPLIEAMEDAPSRSDVAEALASMKAEATPILIHMLGSQDPLHREHAAFILGEFRSAAVIKSLIALLGDQSRDVHTAAYEALAKIGEDALDDILESLHDPDPNIRIGIANALGRMAAPASPESMQIVSLDDLLEDEPPGGLPGDPSGGTSDENEDLFEGSDGGERVADNEPPALLPETRKLVVSLLMQLLEDENHHVRDAASAALRRVGESSARSILDELNSPDAQARKDAIHALGQSLIIREIPAAIPPLIEALFDEDPEIRFLAAKSLRYAKDERTVTPLNACLLDVDPKVRQEAVEGLRRRKDPRILDPLVHCLQDDSPGVRRIAACALGELGDQGARDALEQCKNDDDRDVRDAAARSLGMLGPDPRTDPHILIRSTDPIKRSGALTALGEGRDDADLDLITGALCDEDAGVRRTAAEALCGFSNPRALQPLLNALADTDESVRKYALRALVEINDPRVLLPVIIALEDTCAPVRAEAVSHLRKIGDTEAVPYLIEALGDPDAGVCQEAILLLGNIGGEHTLATLRDLEQKTQEPLKLAAVRTALDQIARMNKTGGEARAEVPKDTAAERVVISHKKKEAPVQPHPPSVIIRKKTEKPGDAGASPECHPLKETNPQAARVWQNLLQTAGGYIDKEEFEFAKPLLEKAYDMYPDSELLVARLGFTLSRLGHYEDALIVYEKGIELNTLNDEFWSNLGALLANLERYDEALHAYKQALALCMSDAEIWYQTGIVLNNLERFGEAVKCFDRALLLDPEFSEATEGREIAQGNVGK
ncbi:MAG: HEAT repeat domain-containing protein [Methanoregula sp.]|jgi:HEAT repeat protein/predicted negative regulator of RcsB-dependent stress response